MLPTIIFFLALLISIFTLLSWINLFIKESVPLVKLHYDFKWNTITTIVSCVLWSYLFYLLH